MPPAHVLASLVPESPAFADLIRTEHQLDWTLLRKRAQANDALGRPTKVKRTLRVYLSYTAYNQAAQQSTEETLPDPVTGQGVPGWTLRIEGRLLDVSKTVKARV